MKSGQQRLSLGAASIDRIALPHQGGFTINVLTGARYWDQTVGCLWTLFHQSGRTFPVRILDDGSLLPQNIEVLSRLSPEFDVQREATSLERMNRLLPELRFPTLHRLWQEYKHIRKLTDGHLGQPGLNVVLDSDMLFHRRPDALLDYLAAPDGALAMRDCQESYGYPRSVLSGLTGAPVPEAVNVGLVALHSESIRWPDVEQWARTLIDRHGRSYFLEQALVAMWLSTTPHSLLPRDSHAVIAEPDDRIESTAQLVHYVHASKRQYFDRDWQAVFR